MSNPKQEFVDDLNKDRNNQSDKVEDANQPQPEDGKVADDEVIDYSKLSSEELLKLYKEKFPDDYDKLINDIVSKFN